MSISDFRELKKYTLPLKQRVLRQMMHFNKNLVRLAT